MKHWQEAMGKERVRLAFGLQFIIRESQGRNWSRCHGGWDLLASSAAFLTQLRLMGLEEALPTVGWSCLHRFSMKKIPLQTCPQVSLMEAVPQLTFLLPKSIKWVTKFGHHIYDLAMLLRDCSGHLHQRYSQGPLARNEEGVISRRMDNRTMMCPCNELAFSPWKECISDSAQGRWKSGTQSVGRVLLVSIYLKF